MAVDRGELEALDRDTLIARAEAAGVTRARILTRPELIDELLMRAANSDRGAARKARGFFGIARDLLARVVERGLHLPDAAEIIRATAPPSPMRNSSPPLPTVTLAEIYATQGHVDRALETLRKVLDREPDHAAARALVARLTDSNYEAPKPPLPPEDETTEVTGARPPEPAKVAHDHCIALPIDATTAFVSWALRDVTLAYARDREPHGVVALRLLAIVATWDGPRTRVLDVDVHDATGEHVAFNLPNGVIVRAAIGWRADDHFLPLAHSPALEAAQGSDSLRDASSLVRWTLEGARSLKDDDDDARAIAEALASARRALAASTAKYARV